MRNEIIGTTNGQAFIDPEGLVVAGSADLHFRLTYVAGEEGIAPGGSVRFEIPYGFTAPQLLWHRDPGYVVAECSRASVQLSLSLEPPVKLDPEPFYYVTRWGRQVYVQVLGNGLRPGDTLRLYYGGKNDFSAGVLAQHFAGEPEFTVATDCDGARSAPFSGYTLVQAQPTLQVIAGVAQRLLVVAPSIVEPEVDFDARVVPLDCFDNASPYPLDTKYEVAEPAGDVEHCTTVEGQRHVALCLNFALPGERSLEVHHPETGLSGYSNPILCLPERPEMHLYWGDIHGHSLRSDGLGSPAEYYTYGREEALLDFCALTDHAQYLSDEDWEEIQAATAAAHDPHRYVTLLGYEYSCNARLPRHGDKCLYYPGDEGPLLRETDINRSAYHDMAEFAEEWKRHGAMMILHQHAGGTSSFYDPDLVRLAEVYSIWGGSESPQTTRPLLPSQDRDYRGNYVADVLAQGWRLGLMASSDDHAGRPGKTDWLRTGPAFPGGLVAVWAPELTREALWEALWNRRCYGATGVRTYLEFFVDGEPMGSEVKSSTFSGGHRLQGRVMAGEPVVVEILRGQEVIAVEAGTYGSLQFELLDVPPPGAANYYYVRVTQAGGDMAWSSPVWVG